MTSFFLTLNMAFAASQEFANGVSGFFSKYGVLFFWGAALIVIILLMIVPQKKRDKQIKEMMEGMKNGDKVRTIGGICGTITNIKDEYVTIAVGPDKVKLVFVRGAIATVENATVEKTLDEAK